VGFSAALHCLHWSALGRHVLPGPPLLWKQLVILIRTSAFADDHNTSHDVFLSSFAASPLLDRKARYIYLQIAGYMTKVVNDERS
jgi:hypothetical protein